MLWRLRIRGIQDLLTRWLQQTLAWRAQQIASTYLEEIPTKGGDYVSSEIQTRYAPELNERVIRLVTSDGRQVYGSKNSDVLTQLKSETATDNQSDNIPIPSQVRLPSGEWLQVVTVRHRIANGSVYAVQVGAPENDISSALAGLIKTLILGFPLLIGLAVGGDIFSLAGR